MTASTRPGARHPRTWWSVRRPAVLVALLVCALLAGLGGAATASPRVPKPPKSTVPKSTVPKSTVPTSTVHRGVHAAAAPDPRIVPLSQQLPQAIRDEASVNIGNQDYGGRTRVEGDANGNIYLNTYAPPDAGGTQLFHLPIDLNVPWATLPGDPFITDPQYDLFVEDYSDGLSGACRLCFASLADTFHINTVYTAGNSSLYVSGIKGNSVDTFGNWLYWLGGFGPCDGQACVFHRALLSTFDPATGRPVVTTALAAPFIGERYLAVGLSDGRVLIMDGDLNQVATFTVPHESCCQESITSLAWDPSGSGKLAIGAMGKGPAGYVITVDATKGTISPTYATWDQSGTDNLTTVPLSVAWGKDANGNPILGWGVNNQRLMLASPTTGGTTATYTFSDITGGVSNVNAVPRIDGTSGGDDWAVTVQPGSDIGAAEGALVRFTGTAGAQVVLRPPSGSDDGMLLKSLDDFRSWFPGWVLGVVQFADNETGGPLNIQLYARPEQGYGCWYTPALSFPAPIPPGGVVLPPGSPGNQNDYAVVGAYTSGTVTSGSKGGGCNAGDVTSTRRGYLVVSPGANRPDDALIVNLTMNDSPLTYDVTDTSGGPITVTGSESLQPFGLGPYRELDLSFTAPAQPTPTAAPTILNAVQLNNLSVRGRTPVYRVDVGPQSWTVPGAAAGQRQAVLPALQVQGTLDGKTWTDVGQFMPVTTLNQSGNTVTAGNAATRVPSGSFFWENPAGAPAYTQLRVVAGSLASAPIVLSQLPGPAVPTSPVTSINVTPAKSGVTTASVAANGVDQAQLLVQVSSAGKILDAGDPAYGLVYYRDDSGDLITNLYAPGAYSDFVGVQPSAGAYPNNGGVGLTRGGTRKKLGANPAYDYVSSADSGLEKVIGYVGSAAPSVKSETVNVQGGSFAPTMTGGKAVTGIGFEGCADYAYGSTTCQLAAVTPGSRPALYQAGGPTGGPQIGVQLQLVARNALGDLPLQWSAGVDQTKLATAHVTISNNGSLAQIAAADKNNFAPSQNIDLSVISHGQLIPVTSLNVGGN